PIEYYTLSYTTLFRSLAICAECALRSANLANTSPQTIPSRQNGQLPLQFRDSPAPSGRREAHPCGSSHASSFPQLPFRGSRSVLRATLLRRVRFGTAIGVRSLFFVARTQPLLMTPPRFWQSLPPVAPILGFRY